MNPLNSQAISSKDAAERIIDDLNDFQADGLINGSTFKRKTSFLSVLKALNHADRVVCRDLFIEKLVVVYIPPGANNIFLSQKAQDVADIQEAIHEMDLEDSQEAFFLSKYDYTNVLSVESRFVDVFNKYPVGPERSEKRFTKVSLSDFFNTDDYHKPYSSRQRYSYINRPLPENKCVFILGENRFILGQTFDTPRFARFNARVMPGILDVTRFPKSKVTACDYDSYATLAPHYSFEYFLAESLLYLIPKSNLDARRIVATDRNREKDEMQRMKPSDNNVIVPYHSFG